MGSLRRFGAGFFPDLSNERAKNKEEADGHQDSAAEHDVLDHGSESNVERPGCLSPSVAWGVPVRMELALKRASAFSEAILFTGMGLDSGIHYARDGGGGRHARNIRR